MVKVELVQKSESINNYLQYNKMDSFKINPCKAVYEKLENTNCDLNKINDLCYGICSAFGNPDGCKDQCRALLTKKKHQMGLDNCNMRLPYPPIDWDQVPRFFPNLLLETGNVNIAYQRCCEMAKTTRLPNSTKEMCRIDASAVIEENIVVSGNNGNKNNGNKSNGNKSNGEMCCVGKFFILLLIVVSIVVLFRFWNQKGKE